ncbi:MAG: xanthine dehydrogenase subunit XdhA [Eubacteriales bacterium]
MGVGTSLPRVDGVEKVSGRAKYVGDIEPKDVLIAKILRSTIANGVVKSFDLSKAEKLEGVVKIITCFQVPQHEFPTPGHPWSTDVGHQDVSDRRLLNTRVRQYGDDIAVVIATDEVIAKRALKLIEVEYEEYEPVLTVEAALKAPPIHEERESNVLGKSSFVVGEGSYEDCTKEKNVRVFSQKYQTQAVSHCHIEVAHSFAYMENDRIVIVASTQIPHIIRRITGQALGMDWGKIRVIKPYLGGGFGNKQDALYEPLNAFLTTQIGGRAVKIELSREETIAHTRTRHAISFDLGTVVSPEGKIIARKYAAISNQGGYASHGHAIVANSSAVFKQLYQQEKVLESESMTVYTNLATGGAMRGYGIPQVDFAMEAFMDDIAKELGMDPLAFREQNCMPQGYIDPHTKVEYRGNGLSQCIEKGKELMEWDHKRKLYENQSGRKRRGIGMALFNYKTGVHPISLETASCRMVFNQDGSMQLQLGATEIGQGADTVFVQMAAETVGISEDKIHIVSTQDTDISPFDTGAYASRQSYVSGKAVKKTGELLREKILQYAEYMSEKPWETLDIRDNMVVEKATGEKVYTLGEVGLESFYSLSRAQHITAETTSQCKENTFATGATFVEVEVDIPLGKVEILKILNLHDSGTILNPQLAMGQVHGGMSMGLGYALGEELLYDDKGKPLNDNLLDYKLPTALDTPDLEVEFIQKADETGPYGNKALGEPPAIAPAPAVRNAVLQATGVGIMSLPLHPEKLVLAFAEAGLLAEIKKTDLKGGSGNV